MKTNKTPDTFGKRLRATRKFHNLTQEQISIKTGLSLSSIGSYENDRSLPHPAGLEKLSAALNVSSQYLAYGTAVAGSELKINLSNKVIKDLITQREVIINRKKKLEIELNALNLELENNESKILESVLHILS